MLWLQILTTDQSASISIRGLYLLEQIVMIALGRYDDTNDGHSVSYATPVLNSLALLLAFRDKKHTVRGLLLHFWLAFSNTVAWAKGHNGLTSIFKSIRLKALWGSSVDGPQPLVRLGKLYASRSRRKTAS